VSSRCVSVYYEPMQYQKDSHVTARKDHDCCECGDAIKKGTKHRVFSGVADGKWETYRFCVTCNQVGHDYFCRGWAFGRMWEDLAEYLGREIVDPNCHDDEEGEEG
jgi:predicted RNA-binding Zn-ribbon protein involved in translation (DUF1610 family)